MAKKKESKPNFEQSLDTLETIVNRMEEESLPLEELLLNYEEGHKLLQGCQAMIESARKRIEVVQLNRNTCADQTENKLASTTTTGETPAPEDSSDDTRLL